MPGESHIWNNGSRCFRFFHNFTFFSFYRPLFVQLHAAHRLERFYNNIERNTAPVRRKNPVVVGDHELFRTRATSSFVNFTLHACRDRIAVNVSDEEAITSNRWEVRSGRLEKAFSSSMTFSADLLAPMLLICGCL